MLPSTAVPVPTATVPESVGDRLGGYVYDHSLDEFHSPNRQSGFAVVPAFAMTYLNCSPCGPTTIAFALTDGTPVTLNSGVPVSASKARAKLAVNKIAG
jgi:hypothetical protein